MKSQTLRSGALCPVDIVRCHGGPVSHAALDPACREFAVPGLTGLIGFVLVRRCAVVYGDPIAAPADQGRLADAFAAHCAAQGWSILYLAASGSMYAYARARGYGAIEFAELLTGDPRHDPEAGHAGRHLRQNVNRVRRLGVTVREYAGAAAPDRRLEASAEAVYAAWCSARSGPQIYLGRFPLFANRSGRRWFIAEQGGELIGVLSMLRAHCSESRSLINLVFGSPAAPLHTGDLLVVAALQALREEGAGSVAFGIGPRGKLGLIAGFDGVTGFLARGIYRLAAQAMHLKGKTVFWEKYGVTGREPLYLLFQPPRIRFPELRALAQALHFAAI